MKHAVTILLCGWAMMFAPHDSFYDRPVNTWAYQAAYDTALDCENAITSMFKQVKDYDDALKKEARMKQLTLGTRCVPSDWLSPHRNRKN